MRFAAKGYSGLSELRAYSSWKICPVSLATSWLIRSIAIASLKHNTLLFHFACQKRVNTARNAHKMRELLPKDGTTALHTGYLSTLVGGSSVAVINGI